MAGLQEPLLSDQRVQNVLSAIITAIREALGPSHKQQQTANKTLHLRSISFIVRWPPSPSSTHPDALHRESTTISYSTTTLPSIPYLCFTLSLLPQLSEQSIGFWSAGTTHHLCEHVGHRLVRRRRRPWRQVGGGAGGTRRHPLESS